MSVGLKRTGIARGCPRCGEKPRHGLGGKRVCPGCHLHYFARDLKPVRTLRRSRLRPVGRKGTAFNVEWIKVRAQVLERDGYRCQSCGAGGLGAIAAGAQPRLDIHHVVKRAHDPKAKLLPDNLVTLCGGPGGCHDKTDRPYAHGRLVIATSGDGRFWFRTVTAKDKFEAREGACANGQEQC